jgi:hypothetical protein
VTLALVDRLGRPLGSLALPGPTAAAFWPNVDDVVALAREACGVEVTVLRFLSADQPTTPGGAVTYLAQYDGPPIAGLDRGAVRPQWTDPQPLRLPWAKPGGPAASVAWAEGVLAEQGRTMSGAHQMRTWNLSSIWRLDTDAGPVWLKEVPPFFAHEGALLRWLGRPTTPVVVATDGARLLMADIPGTDRFGAGADERAGFLAALLDIQVDAVERVAELLALGVPDVRAEPFRQQVEKMVQHDAGLLPAADRRVLDDLVSGLAARFAALADCGVPDTLVHGDFHPGNVRSDGTSTKLIDWGDSIIAHPALDMIRLRDWEPGGPTPSLTGVWCEFWRRAVPGSDPERAVELIVPLAGLRDAVSYRGILSAIEPAERAYHDGDVVIGLRAAVVHYRTSSHA